MQELAVRITAKDEFSKTLTALSKNRNVSLDILTT